MARTMKTENSKLTAFKFRAPQADRVSVAGSFNNWDTQTFTAKKDSKGNWVVKVRLQPGRYEYKFFVDGSWMEDPKNKTRSFNTFGSQNSVIDVK